MTEKINPKCSVCGSTDSLMWRQIEGDIFLPPTSTAAAEAAESVTATPPEGAGKICQDCYKKTFKDEGDEGEKDSKLPEEKKLRKSTRISKKLKPTFGATTSSRGGGEGGGSAGGVGNCGGVGGKIATKGGKIKKAGLKKSFKPPLVHLPTKYVTSVTHNGSKLTVGDIVSLMDVDDNLFYAQVRGLTVDMYCDKHAFITWLIPTQASPPPNERFEPSTYLIGHDEDTPRPLSLLEFVMHAPSSYYHDRTQPLPPAEQPTGFTWTRLKKGAPRHATTRPPTGTPTCTVTSATAAATAPKNPPQNVVTTTTATVTISAPPGNAVQKSPVPVTDNGTVISTTTTTATRAVAADPPTKTGEQ